MNCFSDFLSDRCWGIDYIILQFVHICTNITWYTAWKMKNHFLSHGNYRLRNKPHLQTLHQMHGLLVSQMVLGRTYMEILEKQDEWGMRDEMGDEGWRRIGEEEVLPVWIRVNWGGKLQVANGRRDRGHGTTLTAHPWFSISETRCTWYYHISNMHEHVDKHIGILVYLWLWIQILYPISNMIVVMHSIIV